MAQATAPRSKSVPVGIVVVGHGNLPRELLATVEHVLGPVSGMRAVRIEVDADRASQMAAIVAAVAAVDLGAGVVVVADLHGSTPANLCFAAGATHADYVLTGANVPMLLKLVRVRHLPLAQAVQAAVAAGRKYIGAQSLNSKELSA